MPDGWSVFQLALFAGFAFFGLRGFYFLFRTMDGRRARNPPALRLFLFPFFVSEDLLTSDGRRAYGKFQQSWGAMFLCWVLALITTAWR
ncbi:hypothetical protein [Phenylobacterium sp.]|jgi:hypothetical protein|uniref:hypothetical protein n=1 Tax=Phenylobacterium sp. TaxID=1871053 RepID=UPI002F958750